MHKDNGIVQFKHSPEGLYYHEVSDKYLDDLKVSAPEVKMATNSLVETVAKNRKNYMTTQYEHAKRARKLYHIIGIPTLENYKALLSASSNCC